MIVHVHSHTHTHTHTHSIAGVVVVVVDVFPPQVTGAKGSCAGAEEDTLINTHHNNIHEHVWQSWTMHPNTSVTVQCSNRRSFHCVFQFLCCVQSAVLLNSHYGWGSYVLHRLIRFPGICEAHINPTLTGSSLIQHFKCSEEIKICDSYTGLLQVYLME